MISLFFGAHVLIEQVLKARRKDYDFLAAFEEFKRNRKVRRPPAATARASVGSGGARGAGQRGTAKPTGFSRSQGAKVAGGAGRHGTCTGRG